jgi:glutamine synthetase
MRRVPRDHHISPVGTHAGDRTSKKTVPGAFEVPRYLAFAAMLMAGLDGIQNRLDPGQPIDKNLYDLPPAEAKEVKSTPGSLEQALDALEADHAFLLRGDVFTKDVIETWLGYKRDKEIDAIRLRPHPYEFHLYYDI